MAMVENNEGISRRPTIVLDVHGNGKLRFLQPSGIVFDCRHAKVFNGWLRCAVFVCCWLVFFTLFVITTNSGWAAPKSSSESSRFLPVKLRTPPNGYVTILEDGRWLSWSVEGKRDADNPEVINDTSVAQRLMASFSADEGATWSKSKVLYEFPKERGMHWPVGPGFVDRQGTIHLFGLHYFGLGPQGFYDWDNCKSFVYHVMSDDGCQTWKPPVHCEFGYLYTGAVNGATQLASDRILVPLSYYSRRATGKHVCKASISDDGGKTWRPSQGECVVDTGGHLLEGGAIEPACIQLGDGQVWMLMRTQGGYLYESFSSDDGETWSEPVPSRFVSSNSPAALLRLRDGRLVLVWNNCMSPYDEGGIMTSYARYILAMAISEDEGKSWHGYREFARVHGKGTVTYPFLNECANGDILSQDGGLYRISPQWLMQNKYHEDFQRGLDDWMTLESEGVQVVPHPASQGAQVMSLSKPKPKIPAAASLNFPFGTRGTLKLRIKLLPNDSNIMRQHVYFCLTDFFCMPRLPEVASGRRDGWGLMNVGGIYPEGGRFKFRIAPDGEVSIATSPGLFQDEFTRTSTVIEAGQWHTISLDWDCEQSRCKLSMDDVQISELPQLSRAKGICYLRLWMNAEATAPETLLIESVDVHVENASQALNK